jgi:hypothetical protein
MPALQIKQFTYEDAFEAGKVQKVSKSFAMRSLSPDSQKVVQIADKSC